MEDRGWIKLHRQILENPVVMKDCEHLAVWVYILLNVTHKPYDTLFGKKRITLQPGQMILGRGVISQDLMISESKAQRILKTLENERMIEQITAPRKGRIITVLQWGQYQESERINERIVNEYRTNSERIVNGKQEYKNTKNIKNIKNAYSQLDEKENIDLEKVKDEWNRLPEHIHKLTVIKNKRLSGLKARVSQYGFDEVIKAIKSIKDSQFLLGYKTDFKITFDWFIKPNNFMKVMDGNYLDTKKIKEQKDSQIPGYDDYLELINQGAKKYEK